jgi:hypothetical protein
MKRQTLTVPRAHHGPQRTKNVCDACRANRKSEDYCAQHHGSARSRGPVSREPCDTAGGGGAQKRSTGRGKRKTPSGGPGGAAPAKKLSSVKKEGQTAERQPAGETRDVKPAPVMAPGYDWRAFFASPAGQDALKHSNAQTLKHSNAQTVPRLRLPSLPRVAGWARRARRQRPGRGASKGARGAARVDRFCQEGARGGGEWVRVGLGWEWVRAWGWNGCWREGWSGV